MLSIKTRIKIGLLCILITAVFFFYQSKYTYQKSGEDSVLYLNPFQPDKNYFDKNFNAAEQKLQLGDSVGAKNYYVQALKYRGTFNERQYENAYSDANGLWEYKLNKLLQYSKAYEFIGEADSAISCLSPGLLSIKWHFPIEERFFNLIVRKIGRAQTVDLIANGLNKITKIEKRACWACYECYYCCDYYYEFDKFKIGIDENEYEIAKFEKGKVVKSLCEKYGI